MTEDILRKNGAGTRTLYAETFIIFKLDLIRPMWLADSRHCSKLHVKKLYVLD